MCERLVCYNFLKPLQLCTRSHRISQSCLRDPQTWAAVLLMHESSVRNEDLVLSAEEKLTSGPHRTPHLSVLAPGHAGDLLHSVFCSYLMGWVQGREGGLLIPRGHANSCRTLSTLIPLFPLLIWALSLSLSFRFSQSVSCAQFSSSCLWFCEPQSPPIIDTGTLSLGGHQADAI